MVIFGVALLAACTLAGIVVGEALGRLIGIRADIGGVGFAMVALIAARAILVSRGRLSAPTKLGVEFWSAMYIPIIVAMAATQDVVAALRGGPIVILAAVIAFVLCLGATALLCRSGRGAGPAHATTTEALGVEAAPR